MMTKETFAYTNMFAVGKSADYTEMERGQCMDEEGDGDVEGEANSHFGVAAGKYLLVENVFV